ncbi:MAG TPA: MFS transporter [Flavisolibacter sp.]
MKTISRTVWILSLVSLFADVASEMLYPIVPTYLREIGFSVLLIGVLEGFAGFTAGLTRGYFGKMSDEKGVRLPFIRVGYFLSAVSKPMMAAFVYPLWVFVARTTDRLGKGIRTAARDALLSANATPATKATVFGFHRAMDTAGAAAGPALALVFLLLFPGEYRWLFVLAFIPGLVSVGLTFFLKEEQRKVSTIRNAGFFSFMSFWKISSPDYRKLVSGLLFFALFNSADVFLLLKTKEVTGSDTITIGAYILYNLVFAAASYPLGRLADRVGIRRVLVGGLVVFATVYLLFGIADSIALLVTAFVLYGIYAACTEGISKAWITNLSHHRDTATAVGFFASFESVCTLLASIIAGALWTAFGSTATFLVSAIAALMVAVFITLIRVKTPVPEA